MNDFVYDINGILTHNNDAVQY